MRKFLNGLCYLVKHILYITATLGSFYIILFMFKRLDKSLIESLAFFTPFILLLLMFVINIVLGQKVVIRNLFYNFTCCLVLGFITFACYRAIFDTNMLATYKLGYEINFNYFADLIRPIEVMLYGLVVANFLLIFSKEKKREVIREEISVNNKKTDRDEEEDIRVEVRFRNNENNQVRALTLPKEEVEVEKPKKKTTTTKPKKKTKKD